MAYYRSREAFQLFHKHNTYLRKEQEKYQVTNRVSKRKRRKGQEAPSAIKVSPRDPLLDYKRPRLVELLHEARDKRDKAKRQARVEQAEIEQRAQAERVELEQRYSKLLQEHMQCGLTIARLEAERAEFRAFMERFRSSLRHEEHKSEA
ncbi:hypothetical protein KSC_056980 [Ktedonobacter sp. SOSP1-52]|uniref:hypothetical protein n=1 Tax=Ktedonobacter sp. SOSP1-52 TaxID=2778366 RepID=UPI001916080C|nr:hypothetical protein [Ktedonobacter sp. SOSP1-52]GHO66806.1 hypothetical protein KSC_056980 [Ktedonobacter sp. SOSP1-52]